MVLPLNPHSVLILNFMGAGTLPIVFAIVCTVPSRVSGIMEQSINIFKQLPGDWVGRQLSSLIL